MLSVFWTACDILLGKMSAPKTINLAGSIKEQLPADIINFIKKVGNAAERQQQRLYLVGGVVRDLLLEHSRPYDRAEKKKQQRDQYH